MKKQQKQKIEKENRREMDKITERVRKLRRRIDTDKDFRDKIEKYENMV